MAEAASTSGAQNGQGHQNGSTLKGQSTYHGPTDANWEVAYIYAFLHKFTTMTTLSDAPNDPLPVIATPMEFEAAIDDFRSTQEPNAILETVMAKLCDLGRTHNDRPGAPKEWQKWLEEWVARKLKEEETKEGKGPYALSWGTRKGKVCDANAKWTSHGNKLKDAGSFWNLKWDDCIHLMRLLVDWGLSMNPDIKNTIAECYNLGPQKATRRDITRNRLVVDRLGTDKDRRVYIQVDDSPRVYMIQNPYKRFSAFHPVSSTQVEFESFIPTLTHSHDKELKAVLEYRVRSRIQEGEAKRTDLAEKREKFERKEEKRKREEQAIANLPKRQTRQRQTKEDPAYASPAAVDNFLKEEEAAAKGRGRKRKRDESTTGLSELDEDSFIDDREIDELEEENEEFQKPIKKKRRSSRQANEIKRETRASKALPEWKGERRSSRLHKAEQTAEIPIEDRERIPEAMRSTNTVYEIWTKGRKVSSISNVQAPAMSSISSLAESGPIPDAPESARDRRLKLRPKSNGHADTNGHGDHEKSYEVPSIADQSTPSKTSSFSMDLDNTSEV
ncbi:hypothetical protein BT69DRAFT_1292047 [Atractiella rhizophila]|nr:hypothetical protein BT69DRAFT_1292047 [Atractiella rhizophila]